MSTLPYGPAAGHPRANLRRAQMQARGRASDTRARGASTPAAVEAARLRAADPAGRYAALVVELDRLAQWEADAARRRWAREGYRA
jgi:hypothetical protein